MLETVGSTITLSSTVKIDIISAYCPKGDCDSTTLSNLFSSTSSSNYIIGGDFNGHHNIWESHTVPNRSGSSIVDLLESNSDIYLITPIDLGTRTNPITGYNSTIDLTFCSTSLTPIDSVRTGPYWGSDHLPVFVIFHESYINIHPNPKWNIVSKLWPAWNSHIHNQLITDQFQSEGNPALAYDIFYGAMHSPNKKFFSPKKIPPHAQREPAKPWWTIDCKIAEAKTRRARKKWLLSPCNNNKIELNSLEAL